MDNVYQKLRPLLWKWLEQAVEHVGTTHPIGKRAVALNRELHRIPGTVIPLIAGSISLPGHPAIKDFLDRLGSSIGRVLDSKEHVEAPEIVSTMDQSWELATAHEGHPKALPASNTVPPPQPDLEDLYFATLWIKTLPSESQNLASQLIYAGPSAVAKLMSEAAFKSAIVRGALRESGQSWKEFLLKHGRDQHHKPMVLQYLAAKLNSIDDDDDFYINFLASFPRSEFEFIVDEIRGIPPSFDDYRQQHNLKTLFKDAGINPVEGLRNKLRNKLRTDVSSLSPQDAKEVFDALRKSDEDLLDEMVNTIDEETAFKMIFVARLETMQTTIPDPVWKTYVDKLAGAPPQMSNDQIAEMKRKMLDEAKRANQTLPDDALTPDMIATIFGLAVYFQLVTIFPFPAFAEAATVQ